MELKTVCAWCGKTIGTKDTDRQSKTVPISHGICRACKDRALEGIQKEKPQNQEGK